MILKICVLRIAFIRALVPVVSMKESLNDSLNKVIFAQYIILLYQAKETL